MRIWTHLQGNVLGGLTGHLLGSLPLLQESLTREEWLTGNLKTAFQLMIGNHIILLWSGMTLSASVKSGFGAKLVLARRWTP